MQSRSGADRKHARRGATLVLASLLIVMMLGMVAFAVDMGYIVLVRTQLQVAADSAAMAAAASMGLPREELMAVARQYAGYHSAGGRPVQLEPEDVKYGTWDTETRSFRPSDSPGNAIRVTSRTDETTGGRAGLFFGKIFGKESFTQRASAVAMANPRDIAFVVDLSGSMNDDTEPCWASGAINEKFASDGYPTIGSQLMQQLYDDFGYGSFPGELGYLGEPWGARQDKYAYAELTKDGGPLTAKRVPSKYRIKSSDDERTRKRKAYSAIIDRQIARLMPGATPAADSSENYAYWEKYLDYVIQPVKVASYSSGTKWGSSRKSGKKARSSSGNRGKSGGGSATQPPKRTVGGLGPDPECPWYAAWMADPRHRGAPGPAARPLDLHLAMAPGGSAGLMPRLLLGAAPGTPPQGRGWLPPGQDGDRISSFNNPNPSTFPGVSSGVPRWFRNRIGYLTYVQFMVDHGRDLKPVGDRYVPLSHYSRFCPWHAEETAGGVFRFPPRAQPMHAARRSLIAAMEVVRQRNASIVNPTQRDWVSVITFDSLRGGGPVVQQPLTADYEAAMESCTSLQAVGDKGASTATETGMIEAREHLRPQREGGAGRSSTNKVVVLLTDGVPNLYSSHPSEIDAFIAQSESTDFYSGGAYWYDAPLMQAAAMQAHGWSTFPVGVGLGTDYDFMDRLARLGGTANEDGQSARGTGNPVDYEQRLTQIFEQIITNPKVRLVE